MAVDRGHDLTLLKVEPRPGGFPALKLAPRRPAAGDEVFILGTHLRHSVLFRGRSPATIRPSNAIGEQYIEITHVAATVPGGMSGGAWLNAAGEVVGLQSGVMSHDTIPVGIAFAGPLEAIRTLLKTERTAATPTLGAALEELWAQDDKLLARYPPLTEGLIVRRLQADGPAARAGLKIWDLITAADGKKVRLTDELPADRLRKATRPAAGADRTGPGRRRRAEDHRPSGQAGNRLALTRHWVLGLGSWVLAWVLGLGSWGLGLGAGSCRLPVASCQCSGAY